ncbi:E3 CR1-delta0 [simian adenovirus 21]|uniref:E3 CR1-delta0 n=1 Tax=simian adenovirus 21 TaxID=198503 RepID=UPI0000162134|nr:E3 CR1-delta0 [Simian adenovirus 21]
MKKLIILAFILFQSYTTNTTNVQTTLNHSMENHTTSYKHTNITTHQPKYAMQLEITILIVIAILIISIIFYFTLCRQIPNIHRKRRPIYCPMISQPHMTLNEI